MQPIDGETVLKITQTAIRQVSEHYNANLTDDELNELIYDLEVDCAAEHGFNPALDEDAAWWAQNLYRNAFLAVAGRSLAAFYDAREAALKKTQEALKASALKKLTPAERAVLGL